MRVANCQFEGDERNLPPRASERDRAECHNGDRDELTAAAGLQRRRSACGARRYGTRTGAIAINQSISKCTLRRHI